MNDAAPSPAETAAAIDATINRMGGALMFHPDALAVGSSNGLDDVFAFYVGGRTSVLGDVEPDVVRSALAWFHPDAVASQLATAHKVHGATELRDLYAEALAAAGRASFAQVHGIERFVELGSRVVESVEPMGTALFAGWRSVPRLGDPAGAAGLLVQTLRELRGDLHIHAVAAAGLTPLQALMARDGADRARMFGWPEPYPDGTPWAATHAEAEVVTARSMAACYAVLDAAERADLVAVVERMAAATRG